MEIATSGDPAGGATRADRGDRGDRGDVVVGWITKMIVVTGLVGMVGFDALSVGVTKMNVTDDASLAVEAASNAWQSSKHDIQAAFDAAQQALPDPANERLDPQAFSIDADGTVHVTVHKKARTLFLSRIDALADYAEVSGTVSGKALG